MLDAIQDYYNCMGERPDKPIEEVTTAIINRLLCSRVYWVTLTSGHTESLIRQKVRFEYALGSFLNIDKVEWGPFRQITTLDYIIFCMAPTGPFFIKALLSKKRSVGIGDSICLPTHTVRLKNLPDIPQRRA